MVPTLESRRHGTGQRPNQDNITFGDISTIITLVEVGFGLKLPPLETASCPKATQSIDFDDLMISYHFLHFLTYNQINNFNNVGLNNRIPLHRSGQVLSEAGGRQIQEAHAVHQIHQPRQEYRSLRLAK
jgi:hypothetical protein